MSDLESECQQCRSPVGGGGVTSSSQTLLSSISLPHFKTSRSLERTKIMVMGPDGAQNHKNCAGWGQKQFTGVDWS
jgi:hypothetical protein